MTRLRFQLRRGKHGEAEKSKNIKGVLRRGLMPEIPKGGYVEEQSQAVWPDCLWFNRQEHRVVRFFLTLI